MCTYSEMRILQLIVSGTLANAGRPERVKNKNKQQTTNWYLKYQLVFDVPMQLVFEIPIAFLKALVFEIPFCRLVFDRLWKINDLRS
jgi:hypothetical protein